MALWRSGVEGSRSACRSGVEQGRAARERALTESGRGRPGTEQGAGPRRQATGAEDDRGGDRQARESLPSPRRRIRASPRSLDRAARLAIRRSRRIRRAVLLGTETTPLRWFHT